MDRDIATRICGVPERPGAEWKACWHRCLRSTARLGRSEAIVSRPNSAVYSQSMSKWRPVFRRLESTIVRLFGDPLHRPNLRKRVGNACVQRFTASDGLDGRQPGTAHANGRAGAAIQDIAANWTPAADQRRHQLTRSTWNRSGGWKSQSERQIGWSREGKHFDVHFTSFTNRTQEWKGTSSFCWDFSFTNISSGTQVKLANYFDELLEHEIEEFHQTFRFWNFLSFCTSS